MPKFLTHLQLENACDDDEGKWLVAHPLIYQSDIIEDAITVPFGFQTDLASIPRLPIIYWLTGNTSQAAAVVHDYLYVTHVKVSRRTADRVLLEASELTRVSWWRRVLMYLAVRLFGGSHWVD